MVSIVAATGDLFLATERIRVTLAHVRKKLRFCNFVSPDSTLEDLEGRATILHPAHVTTSLVVPTEPREHDLRNLVRQTVRLLLLSCPKPDVLPEDSPPHRRRPRARRKPKRARLVTDTKLPFVFGTTDYLAIVRIKWAHARGETVGVLGRSCAHLTQRSTPRLRSPHPFPVLNPGDHLAPAGLSAALQELADAIDQLTWLRC